MAGLGNDIFGNADSAAADLYSHASDFLPDNGSIDPDVVHDRLIRKLYNGFGNGNGDRPNLRPPVVKTPSSQGGPRLSDLGDIADPEGKPPVPKGMAPAQPQKPAEPAEPTGPQGADQSPVGVGLSAAVQSAVKGVVADPLKAAALIPEFKKEAYGQLKPAEIDQDPNKPAFTAPGAYRKEIAAQKREQAAAQAQIEKDMETPVQQRPLFQAGEAVSKGIEKAVPLTDDQKQSISAKVGSFVGGVGGAAGLTLLGSAVGMPGVGMALGATQMGMQGAASAFEDAVNKGATPEEAAHAAGLNGLVSGALGAAPLGAILAPIKAAGTPILDETGKAIARQISPGFMGWAAAKLEQAVKSGVTFAGIGEAQEYLSKQIAAEYNGSVREKLQTDKAKLQTEIDKINADPRLAAANADGLKKAEAELKSYDEQIKDPSKYQLDWERAAISFFGGAALGMVHPHGMVRGGEDIGFDPDWGNNPRNPFPPPPLNPNDYRPPEPPPGAKPGGGGSYTDPATGTTTRWEGDWEQDFKRQQEAWEDAKAKYADWEKNHKAQWEDWQAKNRPPGAGAPMGTGPSPGAASGGPGAGGGGPGVGAGTGPGSSGAGAGAGTGAGTDRTPPPPGTEPPRSPDVEEALRRQRAKVEARQAKERQKKAEARGSEAARRAPLEETLRDYGLKDEHLSGMSFRDLRDALSQRDVLTTWGWSKDEIRQMTPEQFTEALKKATDLGHGDHNEQGTGYSDDPVTIRTAADVHRASSMASQDHSHEQGEAHNVQQGYGRWNGIDIAFEAPAGGIRRGTNPNTGETWEGKVGAAYGYIPGTKGADGMPIDVYVGPHPDSPAVFVINELNKTGGGFRQTKSMVGFRTAQDAVQAYLATDGKQPGQVGGVVGMSIADFKNWVSTADHSKPAGGGAQPSAKPQEPAEGQRSTPGAQIKPDEALTGAAEGITEGLHKHMWARIQAGDTKELGKPSAILQAAKYIRDNGGLKTYEQYRAVADDYGRNIKPGSPTFQSDMRALVRRHLPKAAAQATSETVAAPGTAAAASARAETSIPTEKGPDRAQHQGPETQVEPHHVAAIETALHDVNVLPETVAPNDIAVAAEIYASTTGISPEKAFELAVLKNALAQGYLTPAEVESIYGKDQEADASAVSEGSTVSAGKAALPSGGGETVAAEGAKSEPAAAGEPEESGQLQSASPHGGETGQRHSETGAVAGAEGAAATEAVGQQHETAGPEESNDAGRTHGGGGETSGGAGGHEGERIGGTETGAAAEGTPGEPKPAEAAESEKLPVKKEQEGQFRFGSGEHVGSGPTRSEAEPEPESPQLQAEVGNKSKIESEAEAAAKKAYETGKNRLADAAKLSKSPRWNPYRSGEERAIFSAAFERLFKALQADAAESDKTKIASTEAEARSLPDAFAAHFRDGLGFPNILQGRRFAKEHGHSEDAKTVEEALELGVVKVARELVRENDTPTQIFEELVDLYDRQPRLGTRTSTSVRDQAYSTPVPLAYVASQLAGITPEKTVYEPTAGNGALLIAADPKNVIANEINPERSKNLEEQGFKVTGADASEGAPSSKQYDVVIANPPFGPVKQDDGTSKNFDLSGIQKGYYTNEIDHVIALRALEVMKDDGRAVLILGGIHKMAKTDEDRTEGYRSKAKREFYKALYDRYNVVDNFTVVGELYAKQGAEWPVDVVVINGRGKSAKALPGVKAPRIYNSWDEIGRILDNVTPATSNAGEAGELLGSAPDEGATPGTGEEVRRSGGNAGGQRDLGPTEPQQPEGVLPGVGAAGPGVGGAGDQTQGRSGGGGGSSGVGGEPDTIRPPHGLKSEEPFDFDSAFQESLDNLFPEERETPAATAPGGGGRGGGGTDGAKTSTGSPEPEAPKGAGAAAAGAAKSAGAGVNAGLDAFVKMFGGGKTIGMGVNFDEKTYQAAKPKLIEAANHFKDSWGNFRDLLDRMMKQIKRAYTFTKEQFLEMSKYLKRFFDDLQSGAVKLGEEERKPPAERPADMKAETETANQVTYKPRSKMPGLGTLVPVNMRHAVERSLAKLEEKVGPIDDFLSKELGMSLADIEKNFGAEQVDALALAIDNAKQGKGTIVGDQTGVGKGRVVAGMARWAIVNGHIPIFTTKTPALYADIFRDLHDTGIEDYLKRVPRILPTNTSLKLDLTEDGSVKVKTGSAESHNLILNRLGTDNFAADHDILATTYNQMQTLKGQNTPRRALLGRLAPNAVLLFDESHEAGGQAQTRQNAGAPPNRSQVARELIQQARGVLYSSATYAKRPDVMDLYSATDMKMAVDKIEDLAPAIQKGGVPMQQVVASALAEAGQYIRRERSFAGVNYDTPLVPVDHDQYDRISHGMAAIQDFSKLIPDIVEKISHELAATGSATLADGSIGEAGLHSTNFTAIMHNIVNQMLLAMKSKPVVDMAVEAIKKGQKPVITVANTLESFLKDFADENGIKTGGAIKAEFTDILQKYLDRTRTILIKPPYDEPVIRHYLTDEQLGEHAVGIYRQAKDLIQRMDLSGLPISPIDHIKNELQRAGYSIGEITGRGMGVDYSGDEPIIYNRPSNETSIPGRNNTLKKFNDGRHDVLILNQAGSTGISAHASKTFKDQRQRHMMIAQAEGNIDTHMQMLGRIHRTGQVALPYYSQMVADIPAEKRPAAVLAKKMASLNANTTASRGSALTAKDVPDFINEYGDAVAVAFLNDNPEMMARLGNPVKHTDAGGLVREDAMRKLTGRIPLLPLKQQEEIYQTLENEYKSLMDQLNASGENSLEAKTLDLKAQTLEYTEVVPKKNDSGSPFAAPVIIHKARVVSQGKSMTPKEVIGKILDKIGDDESLSDSLTPEHVLESIRQGHTKRGRKVADLEGNERGRMLSEFADYKRSILDDIENVDRQSRERLRLDAIKDRWSEMHQELPIGKTVTIRMMSGNILGVVIDVHQTGTPKNPLALGSWKVTFATPDAGRQLVIPFSRLYRSGQAPMDDPTAMEVAPRTIDSAADVLHAFERTQRELHETRYIASGNLLAAYDWLGNNGTITHFTDSKGNVRQGILLAKDFDLGKHAINKGQILERPAEIVGWMDSHRWLPIWDKSGAVRIRNSNNGYTVTAERSKKLGGKFYLDKNLAGITGDFYSRNGAMETVVARGRIMEAIKRMQEIGAKFTTPAAGTPKAVKVEEPPPPEPPSGGGTAKLRPAPPKIDRVEAPLSPLSPKRMADLSAAVTDLIRRIAGPSVDIKFEPGAYLADPDIGPGWGKVKGQAVAKYNVAKGLIEMALGNGNITTDAIHEALHHIQNKMASDRELAVLKRETPRLRRKVGKAVAFTPEELASISDYEIQVIAGELYFDERARTGMGGEGLHIGVRTLFERIFQLTRQLGNLLRGLGFDTSEKIFGKAYTGEMASRTPREGQGIDLGGPGTAAAALPWSRGTPPPPSLAERLGGTRKDRAIEGIYDLSHRVKLLQAEMQGRPGAPFADRQDFYTKKRLYPGRVAEEIGKFNKEHVDPIIDLLKRSKIDLQEAGDFIYALHAEERNAAMGVMYPPTHDFNKAINDPTIVGGSGMSKDQADAIIRASTGLTVGGARRAAFRELDRRHQAMRNFILNLMERSGLESAQTIQDWRQKYAKYADLRGWEDVDPDDVPEEFRDPARFNVRGPEVKRAFGRGSKASNPLVNIIDQANRTVQRAEKNRYLVSLAAAVQDFIRTPRAGPRTNDVADIVEFADSKTKKAIDPTTGLVREVPDTSHLFDPKAVAYKVRGDVNYLVFKSHDLAEAVKRMQPDELHGILKVILRVENMLKSAWTHYSPDFMVRHFLFRYPIEGAINAIEQREHTQAGGEPHSVSRYVRDAVPFMGAASKAIFATNKGMIHPDPRVAELQQSYELMRQEGGAMQFRNRRDIADLREHLQTALMELSRNPLKRGLSNVRKAVEAMDVVTNALDNSLRLAAFHSALRAGQTPQQAALISREATVDFQLKGRWSNLIGLWAPFGNVALQTGARMGKALKRSRTMRWVFGGTVLAGFLVGMFNYLIGGNDERDGIPFFEKIPESDRRLNMIIINPFDRDSQGRPQPFKIPMQYNWVFPLVLGYAAAEMAFGHEKGMAKIMAMVFNSALETLTPLGSEHNISALMAPEIVRPLVHVASNKDWKGSTIHADPILQKKINSESGFKRTDENWKMAARAVNAATGGDKKKPGLVDLYPEDIREFINYAIGVQLRMGHNIAETAGAVKNAITGENPDEQVNRTHIPLSRVFYGTDYDASDRARKAEAEKERRHPALRPVF
jgi:hypothetical protein